MDEYIEKIRFGIRKYLILRKVLRTVELIGLSALIIIAQFSDRLGPIEFICFLFSAFAFPESILAIKRSNLKLSINHEKLVAEIDILFCSEMIYDYETMKEEIISNDLEKNLSEKCKQLIWKEKVGTGSVSSKIEYFKKSCKEAKLRIKNLESIKRLVIF